MKKIITMLMVLAMMLTLFAGCNSSNVEETTEETTGEAAGTVDTSSLENIINAIYGANPVEFSPMSMPIDVTDTSEDGLWALKTYTGLENADSITEAMFSEAMIGAIPYSLVLVRVAEGADVNAVADAMKSGIDQRKWVCVMADDLQVIAKDDVVMLIMIGSEYGTAQSFVDAFTAVVGAPDYIAE